MLDYVQHGDDIKTTAGGSGQKLLNRAGISVDPVGGSRKLAILMGRLHAVDRESGAAHSDEKIAARTAHVQKRTFPAEAKHKVPHRAIKALLTIASPCAFEVEPGIKFPQLPICGLRVDIAQSAFEALHDVVSPAMQVVGEVRTATDSAVDGYAVLHAY